MDKKIGLAVLISIIVMIGLAFLVNDFITIKDLEQQNIYNTGFTQCVAQVAQTVVDTGYIELVVPAINEKNETSEFRLILVPYLGNQTTTD